MSSAEAPPTPICAPETFVPQTLASKSRKKRRCSLQHICFICSGDFFSKQDLTCHLETHGYGTSLAKPYKCMKCSKMFSTSSVLKHHMFRHTGEKSFICEVCGDGFTQHKNLVGHMRIHTGEKPFRCLTCNMGFRMKQSLKRHFCKDHLTSWMIGSTKVHFCIICNVLLATEEESRSHILGHVNCVGPHCAINLIDDGTNVLLGDSQILDTAIGNTSDVSRVRKYQCRKCYKCFLLEKSLMRHLQMHDMNAS